MARTASLPMYDLPELRGAHDALWSSVARTLAVDGVVEVPTALTRRGSPEELWSDETLLFSQTCGYPLVHGFAGRLRVVATPRYRAPGCEGALYASAVVVGASSPALDLAALRGSVCAISDPASHSGMNVLRAMVAPLAERGRFFREVVVTGAHAASIERVRRGQADVCAVDAVTHALLARHRPRALEGTRVLTWSPPAPALPYVTRGDAPDALVAGLREALAATMRAPDLASARDALLLDGIEVLDERAYDAIARAAEEGASRGYPELA